MRHLRLIPAALVLLAAGSALAQGWHEYVNREDRFHVQFPGAPRIERIEFRDGTGATLPAQRFTAMENQKTYTVTVVRYPATDAATGERAMTDALNLLRATGRVTVDEAQQTDGYPGHTIYTVLPDGSRSAASAHWNEGRVYILAATAPANQTPPIAFHQSLYVLDDDGHRISYVTQNGQRVRDMRCAFCPDTGNLAGGGRRPGAPPAPEPAP
jgi:hypothetical protein